MSAIETTYDLIVIGGGINGAAIARDAALRGMRVLLLEKGDYGNGASSKSSKLAHGGLRYLQQFDFSLVKESLKERNLLFRNAPHLVRPAPFIYPIYRGLTPPAWIVNGALTLYDWMDRSSGLPSHRFIGKERLLEKVGLNPFSLEGGSLYYDGVMNDSRLLIELILSARAAGAQLYNYTAVEELIFEGDKVAGVRYSSRRRGLAGEAFAQLVINATGSWSNQLGGEALVGPTKGIHLVAGRKLSDSVLVLTSPIDRRQFFLLPWEGYTLIGTTDTIYEGDPDRAAVEQEDISYLLRSINHYFHEEPLKEEELLSTFAALRPLLAKQARRAPSSRSRDYRIVRNGSGLVSIVGGKYTTHRKMAEETLDSAIAASSSGKRWRPCATASMAFSHPLPSDESPLCSCHPEGAAALRHAILHEDALTLSDWFYRRTSIGYSGCRKCIAPTAALFARQLGWDAAQEKKEIEDYAATMR